jgi:tRNA(fMet)-specific endonuclease VapC
MNGKLLDTNAASAIIDEDVEMQKWLRQDHEAFVPSIVIGELYFGVYKSSRVQANLARVEEFIAGNSILHCDTETGNYYGQIKQQLKKKGRPIPENDIWIAAIAVQYGLSLVTRDAHFNVIDNLITESW